VILKPKDKQAKGAKGFQSLDNYIRDLRNKGRKVAWTKTLNLGETPPERAHLVMAATAAHNRYVQRPALHLIFSFPPGERPTQPTCVSIVEQSLEWLELGDHQALFVADDEQEHFHLHVMVNVVHPHTHRASKFRKRYKLRRAVAVAAQIERQFGLERVLRPGWTEEDMVAELTGRRPPTTAKERAAAAADQSKDSKSGRSTEHVNEAELHRRVEDVADGLRDSLDRKPTSFKTWEELHRYLCSKGIHYRVAGNGAAMGTGGHETKASNVERGWSLPSLKKQLSGEPPDPLRLGVPIPPRAKPPKPAKANREAEVPLVAMAQKLEATALVIHRVEEDGNKRRSMIATDELPTKIPGLLRAEAKGASILAAPVAADRHFLPVQEMTAEQLDTLAHDHTPAAVVARGDTFDVFVAVPKVDAHPDAQSAATRQLTVELQQQYAPDAPALPPIATLPAPGFNFRAKARGEATPQYRIASLLRPVATVCRAATARFKKLVKDWEAKLSKVFLGRTSNSAMICLQRFDLAGPPQTESAAIYRAHLADMANHSPVKGFSQEAMDRLLAQRLRDGRSSQIQIAEILEAGMLHIHPDREGAPDKARELASWITGAIAMKSYPSILGMAKAWEETTENARVELRERGDERSQEMIR